MRCTPGSSQPADQGFHELGWTGEHFRPDVRRRSKSAWSAPVLCCEDGIRTDGPIASMLNVDLRRFDARRATNHAGACASIRGPADWRHHRGEWASRHTCRGLSSQRFSGAARGGRPPLGARIADRTAAPIHGSKVSATDSRSRMLRSVAGRTFPDPRYRALPTVPSASSTGAARMRTRPAHARCSRTGPTESRAEPGCAEGADGRVARRREGASSIVTRRSTGTRSRRSTACARRTRTSTSGTASSSSTSTSPAWGTSGCRAPLPDTARSSGRCGARRHASACTPRRSPGTRGGPYLASFPGAGARDQATAPAARGRPSVREPCSRRAWPRFPR